MNKTWDFNFVISAALMMRAWEPMTVDVKATVGRGTATYGLSTAERLNANPDDFNPITLPAEMAEDDLLIVRAEDVEGLFFVPVQRVA